MSQQRACARRAGAAVAADHADLLWRYRGVHWVGDLRDLRQAVVVGGVRVGVAVGVGVIVIVAVDVCWAAGD